MSPNRGGAFKEVSDDISAIVGKKPIKIGTIYRGMDIFPAIFGSLTYLQQKKWEITFFSMDKNKFYKKMSEFDYILYPSNTICNVLSEDTRLSSVKDQYILKKLYLFKSDTYVSTFKEFVFLLERI